MKKIMLMAVVLSSAVQLNALDEQVVALITRSATPEAIETAGVIEQAMMDEQFQTGFINLYKEQAKQTIIFVTDHFKKTVPHNDRQELIQALTEIGNWYDSYIELAFDVKRMETDEGQEAAMNCQMQLLQLMQRPFCAAVIVRLMDLQTRMQEDPTAVAALGKKFFVFAGALWRDMLNSLQD